MSEESLHLPMRALESTVRVLKSQRMDAGWFWTDGRGPEWLKHYHQDLDWLVDRELPLRRGLAVRLMWGDSGMLWASDPLDSPRGWQIRNGHIHAATPSMFPIRPTRQRGVLAHVLLEEVHLVEMLWIPRGKSELIAQYYSPPWWSVRRHLPIWPFRRIRLGGQTTQPERILDVLCEATHFVPVRIIATDA